MAKTIKTRIQQKHDTEANWNRAAEADTPFIPLKGELIVYDGDSTHNYERFKIGDGVQVVDKLPFAAYSRSEIDALLQDTGSTATLNIGNGSGTGSLQQTNATIPSGEKAASATSNGATAFGVDTIASGEYSFASGHATTASGAAAHAEGDNTEAASSYQHVQGKYNIIDNTGKYAHIVGNGDASGRSNAHTLDWAGNAWFAGAVHANGAPLTAVQLVRWEETD